MQERYVVTISPVEKSPPRPPADNSPHQISFDLLNYRIAVCTPDGNVDAALAYELQPESQRLTITEGVRLSAGGQELLQSGSYNQIVIDAAAGEAWLHNDTLGVLPCYYATNGGVLRISNSLRLLRREANLPADNLGIAETFLFGGWAIYDRTIIEGGYRAAAGTEYRFDLDSIGQVRAKRIANTWVEFNESRLDQTVDQICDLWDAAVARYFDHLNLPIGLMLSGGLDSRLVAGGLASRGKSIVGMTHGDLNSDEVRIAGEVATATHARWLTNGLDANFPFESLGLEQVNRLTEGLVNPLWLSSAQCLADEGVAHFTTGAGFDVIFGGQKDSNQRRRLLKNIRHSLIGPSKNKMATSMELDQLADTLMGQALKRNRNYTFLLANPYKEIVSSSLSNIRQDLAARVAAIAESSPTLPQVLERFIFDHRLRQFTPMQERQLLAYGTVLLPTYDRDLLACITNLPPGIKYDHYLYYRVIRRLYPDLANIQVTNLGTGVNKSQLQIEVVRAWRILRQERLTGWVNFEKWLTSGGRLAKYEQLFLDQEHFFNPDVVRDFFADVAAGRKHIYDGNETLSFLNLAWLLDERR